MLRRVTFFSGTSTVWRMGGCPTHGRLICLYLSDACASTRLLRSQHQHNNLTARKESKTSEREREKGRQKMADMLKGCWMVLHTDVQMNNEKGRVVLLSMWDIFWGNISLLVKEMMWQKSEGKAVESFASYVRYFKKEEIIHLQFYLLPTFKIIVFCFSSTWSPNWNVQKFNRTFSEWQSITRQISNLKCIPHLETHDDSSYQLCCSHINQ